MRDDDLAVSCKCGKIEITVNGGYHTHDLADAVEIGRAAGELCKDGSLRAVSRRVVAVIVLLSLSGVLGTCYMEERGKQTAGAALNHCRLGERKLQEQDDLGAAEEFTKAIAIKLEVRTLLYRSFCHWRLCDYKACERNIRQALDLDPDSQAARDCLVQLNDAVGK